jgi:hypothetical protein
MDKGKKILLYSVGTVASLTIAYITYYKIVQYKERKGKDVLKEGSFTLIIDTSKANVPLKEDEDVVSEYDDTEYNDLALTDYTPIDPSDWGEGANEFLV